MWWRAGSTMSAKCDISLRFVVICTRKGSFDKARSQRCAPVQEKAQLHQEAIIISMPYGSSSRIASATRFVAWLR